MNGASAEPTPKPGSLIVYAETDAEVQAMKEAIERTDAMHDAAFAAFNKHAAFLASNDRPISKRQCVRAAVNAACRFLAGEA